MFNIHCPAICSVQSWSLPTFTIIKTAYLINSEGEFRKDATPGARYWNQATHGALSFQRVWKKYWGATTYRRNCACKRIQTAFRRFSTMKRVCPLLRIRRHFSKHAYFVFCWGRWKEYLQLLRRIKSYIVLWTDSFVEPCFLAWKQWLRDLVANRDTLRSQFLARARSANCLTTRPFKRWVRHTEQKALAKAFLRRMLLFPYPQVTATD